jgi:L-threonylcarbamoyladenylate synthase
MLDGALVIVPTDTIYGIATVMVDESTIERVYAAREREPEPALPFLINSQQTLVQLARTTTTALKLAQRFWPGPLTLILQPAPGLPAFARRIPIAVRMPNYALLMPLLEAVGGTILVTGAIRSGYLPAITAEEAAALFSEETALILDGGTTLYGVPSTIVDCIADPPVIVRYGPISERLLCLPTQPAPL